MDAATPIKANDYLEAARLRIRHRFLEQFSIVSVMSPVCGVPGKRLQQPDNSGHLEAARLRLRNRFQRKFLPDFTDFPESLETAEAAMKNEQWGASNAVVITMAEPPFQILRVNKCWEALCGYTQREVFWKTFKSLGIQGTFTERAQLWMLTQKLERNERAALHLTNANKDGEIFKNYLRVAPLRDSETNNVTHFIGVLQKESSQTKQLQQFA